MKEHSAIQKDNAELNKESILTERNILQAFDQENSFPLEIFPDAVQQYVIQKKEVSGFRSNFVAAGILSAASTAIGGGKSMHVWDEWYARADFWHMIVSNPSDKKSPSLKPGFTYFKDIDNQLFQNYTEQMKAYKRYKASKKKDDQDEILEPVLRMNIVQDITYQKLEMMLQSNPEGLCLKRDELKSFLDSLTSFGSNDKSSFLSLWGGNGINTLRVDRQATKEDDPFFNLIGPIPYEVLINWFRKDDTADGFLERFLYTLPESDSYPIMKHGKVDPELTGQLDNMLDDLYKARGPQTFKMSLELQTAFKEWSNEIGLHAYRNYDSACTSINQKLQEYTARFILLVYLLENPKGGKEVSIEYFEKAKKLYHFYKNNAFKVRDLILGVDPLKFINSDIKKILLKLPLDPFPAKVGIEIFEKSGKDRATFYRYAKKPGLFNHERGGNYERLY